MNMHNVNGQPRNGHVSCQNHYGAVVDVIGDAMQINIHILARNVTV